MEERIAGGRFDLSIPPDSFIRPSRGSGAIRTSVTRHSLISSFEGSPRQTWRIIRYGAQCPEGQWQFGVGFQRQTATVRLRDQGTGEGGVKQLGVSRTEPGTEVCITCAKRTQTHSRKLFLRSNLRSIPWQETNPRRGGSGKFEDRSAAGDRAHAIGKDGLHP
jgi:hypothetical protein